MVLLVCTLCGLEEYRIMILFICYDLVQYVIQVLSNTLNFSSLILMQDVLNINTPSCLSSSFFQINLQHRLPPHTHTLFLHLSLSPHHLSHTHNKKKLKKTPADTNFKHMTREAGFAEHTPLAFFTLSILLSFISTG